MADIKVRVGQQNAVKVISSLAGAQGLSLSELSDVDASNLQNGMVLVYNVSTQKWSATLELSPGNTPDLDINGGSF
jgi:hypothetical protein|tara:strand:+ start:1466 stop:1693 length:228 start_codon:yes stop_codon:yes gene_type:complete